MRISFCSLLVILLASSCEEPFEYPGALSQELIIDSQLRAGSAPVVNLRAVSALGDLLPAEELAGSVVYLEDSEGNLFELSDARFSKHNASFTVVTDQTVVAGNGYKLQIEAPGYADVTSATTIPQRALFGLPASAAVRLDTFKSSASSLGLPLSIEDVSGVQNFYHILVSSFDMVNRQEGSSSAESVLEPFSISGTLNGSIDLGQDGLLFTDVNFRDTSVLRTITLSANAFSDMIDPAISVEVRTVTETYYNYYRRRKGLSAGKVPDPTSSEGDNIYGAVGIFGGYSASDLAVAVEL